MFCEKCGTKISNDSKFCRKCGAPVSKIAQRGYLASSAQPAPKIFSNKKNIIIIIVAAIILIAGAITAIAIGSSNSGAASLTAQIELAEKYLSEQNYEQAVIEFQKAIEIEPMNVDAYIGLADAYINIGDIEKAIEVLREGIEKTDSAKLQRKLDELTKPAETEPIHTTVTTTEPVQTTTQTEATTTEPPQTTQTEATTTEPPQTTQTEATTTEPIQTTTTKPAETTASQGTVTILGVEYDIASTTYLDLSNKGVTDQDVVEISKLINLTGLELAENQISSLAELSKLTNLTYLDLSVNQIVDRSVPLTNPWYRPDNSPPGISPLFELANLTFLDLSNNDISDYAIEKLKSKLPYCDIRY